MGEHNINETDIKNVNAFVEGINLKLDKFKKESTIIIIIAIIASVLSFGILLLPSAVVCIIIIMFKYSKLYDKNMENDFINTIIKEVSPNLQFSPSDFIQKEHFWDSNFCGKNFERYSGNNLVFGNINNTKIELSNLSVHKTERRYDPQKDMDIEEDILLFNGIFAVVDLEENNDIDLRLTQNKGNEEGFIKNVLVNDDQRVKLENIDFEKLFDVYSNDQIKARQIIDLLFMEKLISLKNKYSGIEVHYLKNKVYVALSTRLGLDLVQNKDLGKDGKIDAEFVLKKISKVKEIIMDIVNLKV